MDISLSMQAKLLTALEKRQITRLGATQPIPIDIRLICATNANIHHLVAEGTFRQDLLYRINTIELHIPPLRERGNDVILLAEHFLSKYARKYKKDLKGINRDGKNKLHNYAWPGNVRELQHAIERAVILSESNWLRPEDFILRSVPLRDKEPSDELNLTVLEKEAIERALRRAEGNITRAAELLGITMWDKGIPVVIAPAFVIANSMHHMHFSGSLSLTPGTFIQVLKEQCRAIAVQGFRKIAIINGHGGNTAPIDVALIGLLLPEGGEWRY